MTVGMRRRLHRRIWARDPCDNPRTGFSRNKNGHNCRLRQTRPSHFEYPVFTVMSSYLGVSQAGLSGQFANLKGVTCRQNHGITTPFKFPDDGFEERNMRRVVQINPDCFCRHPGGFPGRQLVRRADRRSRAGFIYQCRRRGSHFSFFNSQSSKPLFSQRKSREPCCLHF